MFCGVMQQCTACRTDNRHRGSEKLDSSEVTIDDSTVKGCAAATVFLLYARLSLTEHGLEHYKISLSGSAVEQRQRIVGRWSGGTFSRSRAGCLLGSCHSVVAYKSAAV
ncbi:Uncharacterized protein HZ326_16763 [Fusarium oxysporum f. sp. albedinis]|nr:Uncharacterized protein HZ326_16763 [Fusarium oxysporum f. sp. albedinis]